MPTQAKVATHLGVSARTVGDLVASGVIPKPRESDLDAIRLAYIGHLRELAAGRRSEGGLDLVAERARLAKEQADAQEMKNAEERGEYLRATHVEAWLASLLGAMTQRIRAVAPKAAPEVRATGTDAEGEALLATFHDEALQEVADAARDAAGALRRRGRRVSAGGDDSRRGSGGGGGAAPETDGEQVGGRGKAAEPRVKRRARKVEDGSS